METFPKLLLRPTEAAEAVGMSRARIYRAIQEHEIESVLIGRSRRVTPAALQAWISRVGRVDGVRNGVTEPAEAAHEAASEHETTITAAG